MINVETNYLILTDGRRLSYCIYGEPQGVPVFYAHGAPGSRLEGAIFHDTAKRFGFRLLSTDRPGMGQSTFKPNRRLLDYPADIAALADDLGIDKFGVLGWSGGAAAPLPRHLLVSAIKRY
ncbi:MAG: alpha/beta fold hydrolase [Anaerolineales bacterium]|jgi:pimeloyl-ACP methyl ester carboxylesterase